MGLRALFLGIVAVGCAGPQYHTAQRPVAASQGEVGRTTTISGFLYTPTAPFLRDESAHVDLPQAVVSDDVYISVLDARQVCFGMIIRTSAGEDRPLAAWRAHVNGRLEALRETATQYVDYPVENTRTVASAKMVTPLSVAEASITEPAPGSYRVVERTGELCSVRSGDQKVRLELEIPWVGEDWSGEVFEWLLR